ncbi:hypothetical protein [Actinomadura napierensis]|uniref:Isochorismatase family protein n=1 Tax=Actinomadura napierensis TaxID=267854 RepID=A0ABP5KEW6_9ACTN
MVDARAAADEANDGGGVVLGDLCPGWHTERIERRLVARRLDRVSDYQLGCGCLEEITAGTVAELVILCDVQNQVFQRVALAEAIAQGFGRGRS